MFNVNLTKQNPMTSYKGSNRRMQSFRPEPFLAESANIYIIAAKVTKLQMHIPFFSAN